MVQLSIYGGRSCTKQNTDNPKDPALVPELWWAYCIMYISIDIQAQYE